MRRAGGCIVGVRAVGPLFSVSGVCVCWMLMCTVGFVIFALVVCFARGPRETRWFGWRGGWAIKRDDLPPEKGEEKETLTEKSLEEAANVKESVKGDATDEGTKKTSSSP